MGFFFPVTFAYLLACGGWIMLARWGAISRPREPIPTCDRPWVELGLATVVVAGIFLFGLVYRFGFLLPSGSEWYHHLSWPVNNLIIYSPVFIFVVLRKQDMGTVFLSKSDIGRKTAVGSILAIIATAAFLALRGDLADLPGIMRGIVEPGNASNFPAVFLEAVLVAFLFVRVRWALGFWPAILIPAVLFAIGHVPRQLAAGESIGTIVAFFAFNTFLPAAILYVIAVGRDVIWIGIVHYVMDIAIKAFE